MTGQAGCLHKHRSAVTHPSSIHARRCLMRSSQDNRCTRYNSRRHRKYYVGVKTEDVLHGFTHAQYDCKRIVHNTVASPVEHGRRGCPGAETFW
ncbi:hypothetical protein J6590_065687 [Homalodisca vitripennis]|nr:hypothetical protein J6590_065687 [Homalodisca vitripennis]